MVTAGKPRHVVIVSTLLILLLLSVGLIVLGDPGRFWLFVSIVIAAASVGGLAWLLLPGGLTPAQKKVVGAAVGCATLLVGYIALPGVRSSEQNNPLSFTRSGDDPISWDFVPQGQCETFVVDNSLLKSLPRGNRLNAKWVYKRNGATTNYIGNVLIQGNSDDVVVLHRLSIIDVHMEEIPAEASMVEPCNQGGGDLDYRVFDVVLDSHPRLIQRPGVSDSGETTEPVRDFPYKVSKSDVEYFSLRFGMQGPPCICSFRLALDWTSRGRSGRTIIERKFGSGIRVLVLDRNRHLERYVRGITTDDRWDPPLPR